MLTPDPSTAPASDPPTLPAAVVDHDRNCTRCSYNLRGLAINGLCPECGFPVKDSLRGILLRFASPEYLATIHRGVRLVLIGIPIKLLLPIAMLAWFASVGRTSVTMTALQVTTLLASALIILGYWLYTVPDPGFAGTETAGSARAVARITAILSAALIAMQTGIQWFGLLPIVAKGPGPTFVRIAFSVASSFSLAAQYSAMMRYSRWVAKRIPDQSIIRRTQTLVWLLPALEVLSVGNAFSPLLVRPSAAGPAWMVMTVPAGLCPIAALIMYWNLLSRIRKHLKSIRDTGFPSFTRGIRP